MLRRTFGMTGLTTLTLLGSLMMGGPTAAQQRGDRNGNAAAAGRPVSVTVSVPSGAAVWFNGSPTAQTGTRRALVSPPVAAGREYTYDLRVTWREGGREASRSRRITFQAGDAVELTFDSQAARSGSYGASALADSSSYYRPSVDTRPAEGTRVYRDFPTRARVDSTPVDFRDWRTSDSFQVGGR